jgi:hypothetical protein
MTLLNLPAPIAAKIELLLPRFRRLLIGRYAIALCGSYAKGKYDQDSDLDFYLFGEGILPAEERGAILHDAADNPEEIYLGGDFDDLWGVCNDFRLGGCPVEATARSVTLVERVLAECREGILHIESASWTLRGYYYHAYLSDINILQPLEDPHGLIAGWKQQVAVYPPKLKESIIRHHLFEAGMWLDNFHYLSAIQRQDLPFVTGLVQQMTHNIIQVLFAMNERYYSGDKNLVATLRGFAYIPPGFGEDMVYLLYPPHEPGAFAHQREIILAVLEDINKRLVS